MDKPSPLSELLQREEFAAGGTLQRGQYLYRLNRLLQTLVDSEQSLHCQVGNIRDDQLILYCDSPAWASRLRFQLPSLLRQLQQRKGLSTLKRIDVRVLPREQPKQQPRTRRLSQTASSCIQACAAGIQDDKLHDALLRLASHCNKES